MAYRGILIRIRDYLRNYEDRKWSARLDGWLDELDSITPLNALRAHVERSQRATGGMGSLGDLTICPQAGHAIANDRDAMSAASQGVVGAHVGTVLGNEAPAGVVLSRANHQARRFGTHRDDEQAD
jgi:hypothetical protein